MMRRQRTLYLVMALVWGFGGCGGTAADGVAARDLRSGEIETFPSEKDIPAGWAICGDELCEVPSGTPCELLGGTVCEQQPGCRLFPVWCPSSGSTTRELADGAAQSAAGDDCEYLCISDELLCEELQDVEECLARPECAWSERCPACASTDGSSCVCEPACVLDALSLCEQLDQASCLGRSDCEWNSDACPPCPAGEPDTSCMWAPGCQPAMPDFWHSDSSAARPEGGSACQRTGCNGELCSEVPLVTSCEWQEVYLCYDFAICGMLNDGSCGWIPTAEYTVCMSQREAP